ncbi:hypothetical protein KHU50_004960 [Colletotrichum sp. SAR 10_65]|nr:hypothetical protein KHU50_004960 [Colletotrichum sp. SAR 10_65]
MARKYTNKLEGKSVLVVGGTSGIGYAVAEASVEYGANVVVASRTQEKIDSTIKRLKESYPSAADRIRGHVVDLHSDDCETSITMLFEYATNGRKDLVDHVVESAGEFLANSPTLQDATPGNITDFARTRFIGVSILAKVAGSYMKKEYTSSITMTSGVLGYKPMPGFGIKAGLVGAKESLAKGLAVDMAPIRVNLVAPGAVQTPLLDHASENIPMEKEAVANMYRSSTLLNRIGDPEDLAEAYLSMMKNYFITGTTINVEGGFLLK